MSKLHYKTRNMSDPRGKQGVYFCCHPKDFEQYFDMISDDILKNENCVIWYETEPEADYDTEELLFDLSQMKLFIIPITSNFLKTKNRALDVEFKYAVNRHIPILPLLYDGSLIKEFNEICGDIQYLNPYAEDKTEISYSDKLSNYLSNVLVGDEMMQKIRDAFDAYVFLSYRKKDRRYAQELMQKIHKNDFCRDIAIWYDEFLVPGEDFNKSIASALEKCSVFAMTVTPNLVSEDNYVMSIEYPNAKAAGKIIIPTEFVLTNKDELQTKYVDIPECVGLGDDKALTARLLEAFGNIVNKTNDSVPEHNFMIGLAYLNGIDVEVDYEKAMQLITSAAECDFEEAIRKLVYMFRNGEGTKRDLEEAIKWANKLKAIRTEKYQKDKTVSNAKDLEETLELLTTLFLSAGDLASVEKLCYEKVELFEELIRQGNKEAKLSQALLSAYERLIELGMSDLNKRQQYIENADKLCEMLIQDEDICKSNRKLFGCYASMGRLKYLKEDWKAAEKFYGECMDLAQTMLEETTEYEGVAIRRMMNHACGCLAQIYRNLGQVSDAEEWYELHLEAAKKLSSETKADEDYVTLITAYQKMGDFCVETGDISKASACYMQGVMAAEYGMLYFSNYIYYEAYYILKKALNKIHLENGKLDNVVLNCNDCITHLEKGVEEQGFLELRNQIVQSYLQLGFVYQAKGELLEAQQTFEKAICLIDKCLLESETEELLHASFNALAGIGNNLFAQNKWKEAISYYKKAINIKAANLITQKEVDRVKAQITDAYINILQKQIQLAKKSADEQNVQEAIERLESCIQMLEEEISNNREKELVNYLSNVYKTLGILFEKEQKIKEAYNCYEKCLKLKSEFVDNNISDECADEVIEIDKKIKQLKATEEKVRNKSLDLSKYKKTGMRVMLIVGILAVVGMLIHHFSQSYKPVVLDDEFAINKIRITLPMSYDEFTELGFFAYTDNPSYEIIYPNEEAFYSFTESGKSKDKEIGEVYILNDTNTEISFEEGQVTAIRLYFRDGTENKKLSFYGITPDSSREEVLKILGEPTSESYIEQDNVYLYTWCIDDREEINMQGYVSMSFKGDKMKNVSIDSLNDY